MWDAIFGTDAMWRQCLDLLRCLGQELCSFRALLFCLVFDCGIGWMNLSLLVKVWVLLKLQSIAFFYKLDCPLFLLSFRLLLFHLSFSRDLRYHGGPWTYRLFKIAFTRVVFGLVFLGGVLVGSHVCVFRHGVRHLRLVMQSQLVRKLWFHLLE